VQVKTTPKPQCPGCYPGSPYCPDCGERRFNQSDLSIRTFVSHTVEDFTDIDSKFLRTLLLLTFRPGFLSVEFSRGVRTAYMKPFRLFITIAIVNFLAFGLTEVDMYTINTVHAIDKLHLLDRIEQLDMLKDHQVSEMDPARFNKNLKDVLSFTIYFVIFLIAWYLHARFRMKRPYYSENLVFVLHIISAAFLRNIVLLPVLMIHQPSGLVLMILLNAVYVIFALRRFYSIPTPIAVLNLVPIAMMLFMMMTFILLTTTVIATFI
jgi:hypothetical protein